jgi:hypothetical protein|tara:strand:+ start:584 stop:910 length:327 start_codon:yes stop_codon:yes gene_type:complete
MSNLSIIAKQILKELGLMDDDWVALDTIDASCNFVLDQQEALADVLPKRILGDLSLLESDVPLIRRKSLLAFCRRLAGLIEAAILRRRKQVRKDKKTISLYSYKLIQA